MKEETKKGKIIFITALVCIALCIPIGIILGRTLLGKNESNKTNNNVVNKQNNLTNGIIDNTQNKLDDIQNNKYEKITKEEVDKIINKFAMIFFNISYTHDLYFNSSTHNLNFKDPWGIENNSDNLANYLAINRNNIQKVKIETLENENKELIDNGYSFSNLMIKNNDVKDNYYYYFKKIFSYIPSKYINIGACEIAEYNENMDAYILYKNLNACEGGTYFKDILENAIKEENYVYIITNNESRNERLKYTFEFEDGEYKIVSRVLFENK